MILKNARRNHYKIFSEAKIGRLTVSNRLVRSATEDTSLIELGYVSEPVINLYSDLAILKPFLTVGWINPTCSHLVIPMSMSEFKVWVS